MNFHILLKLPIFIMKTANLMIDRIKSETSINKIMLIELSKQITGYY